MAPSLIPVFAGGEGVEVADVNGATKVERFEDGGDHRGVAGGAVVEGEDDEFIGDRFEADAFGIGVDRSGAGGLCEGDGGEDEGEGGEERWEKRSHSGGAAVGWSARVEGRRF